MDYSDIGTFVGTTEQRDKLISNGTTIGHFVEIVNQGEEDEKLIIHVSEPLPDHQDSTHLLQQALNLAFEIRSNVDVTGKGVTTEIHFPKGKYGFPTTVVADSETSKIQNEWELSKPKIQDKQAYYRNFICK